MLPETGPRSITHLFETIYENKSRTTVGQSIETMKPVMLFLTAIRIMNLIQKLWLPVSMVLLSYYAWQPSVIVSILLPFDAGAVLQRLSAYTTTEVKLAPSLETVQQETLSLLYNVSTTILTSTG